MSTANLASLDLITLDSQNRETALDLQSFIVEAPAGAGKTELLTQRYLKLLAVVNEPEEIVALTFSNKATAEMRNRILHSLESAQLQTIETAPHKQVTRKLAISALNRSHELGWHLLTQPARLRIMTIDALCSSLARQMPLLSRFGGQPMVSDHAEAHYVEAARRAMAGVLQENTADGVVATALRYMDNNAAKLGDLIAKMLAKRDQWLPQVGTHTQLNNDGIAVHIEDALQHLIEQDLQIAVDIFTPAIQANLIPTAHFAAQHLDTHHAMNVLLNWDLPLEASMMDLPLWQAVAELLLTKDGNLRKRLTVAEGFPAGDAQNTKEEKAFFKQQKEDFFELTAQYPLLEKLALVRKLPDIAKIADNADTILAISKLLQVATAHLWGVFQGANEVDFVEIAQCARLALGGADSTQSVTDLALKLDYQIKHLLIDEFQDTSPTQKRLIEQLIQGWDSGDGRTLFCVGDPMQSIYRFRKADVSLFLQASTDGIGQLPLAPLRLSRNNRSQPAVIEWINQAFSNVFPMFDNMAAGAISYRAFIATKPAIADEGVTVHPIIYQADSESDSAKAVEARYVAELIQQEKKNNNAHKIAVLVRSRGHLRNLVSEIRRNHPTLTFQAVEIEELRNRQTVQDVLSLTYALLHRADRVHWLSILRAPWCGLMLEDLHKLCANNQHATIWQLMQDNVRLATLSADGQTRLHHVKAVLSDALQNQGRMPLRRWLESTWLILGGAACLVEAGDIRDIQAYFDLVDKLSQVGSLDFSMLETTMKKLYAEPDSNANDSLQFLTIHKSKGLEFDVVILPALNRPPRGSDAQLLLWEEVQLAGKTQLIAAPFVTKKKDAPSSVYQYLQDLDNTRDLNESARLLYVAATRAVKKLHLIATVKSNKEDEIKPVKKSFLELLWPKVAADFSNALALKNETQSALIEVTNTENPPLALADFVPKLIRLVQPKIPLLLQNSYAIINAHHKKNSAHNGHTSDENMQNIGRNLSMDSGTLAHHYMEIFSSSDLAQWSNENLAGLKPAMVQWLNQHGHDEKLAVSAANQVLNALQITLMSPDGQWILKSHNEAQSEISINKINLLEKEIFKSEIDNHRIDRTFIADGIRWIVDYKLTKNDEKINLEQAAEGHRPQLTRYADLFKNEGLPIQKAVLFLSHGILVKL